MEKSQSGNSKTKVLAVFKSLILSYGITALVLLLLAFLLYKFHISEQIVNAGIIGIYVLSCFLGGLYIGKKMGNRKFMWGFLQGLLYFLLLVIVSMIFNKTPISYSQQLVIALAVCVAGGTVGGMLS